ncbi:14023_t:CDS:2 [Gigaspora rosea]|nr:14023_t:CDS:2 [Gigaspora rosea]
MQGKRAKVHDTRAKVAAEKAEMTTIEKLDETQAQRVNVSNTNTSTTNWAESVEQENVVGGISSMVNMDEDSSSSSHNAVNDTIGSKEEHSGKSYTTSGDVACDNNDNQIKIRKGLESNVDTTKNEEEGSQVIVSTQNPYKEAVVVGSEGGSSEPNSHSDQMVVEVSTSTGVRSKEGAEAEKTETASVPIAEENRDEEGRSLTSQEKETNQESMEINTNVEENDGNNNESEEMANSQGKVQEETEDGVRERMMFLNNWTPVIDKEAINIIAGDFNINLKEQENRISQAEVHNDPTKEKLKEPPSADSFTYEYYKEVVEEIVPSLEKLFNKILDTGILPRSWLKNIVTLIPKKSENLEDVGN